MGAGLLASEFFAGNVSGHVRHLVGRVNLFVMGAFDRIPGTVPGNYWTSLDDFPNPRPTPFYICAGGLLGPAMPTASGEEGFTYDPAHPTPMIGGNNLPDLPGPAGLRKCGSADQAARENRSDVVNFDTAPLADHVAIAGLVSAKLFVSSTAPDTDFVVTLTDVTPRGQSMLVRLGVQRMRWRSSETVKNVPMQPDQVYAIDVQLGAVAYIFPRGHRVRMTVASAGAPYFNPTSNTGENDEIVNATPIIAQNTVHYGQQYASQLLLPVVSREQIPANRHIKAGIVPKPADPVSYEGGLKTVLI